MTSEGTGTRDEGVVKYSGLFTEAELPAAIDCTEIIRCRDALRQRDLIGVYPDGVGFGNVSVRLSDGSVPFLISGTQTGAKERTGREDYSLVTSCNLGANRVDCTGVVPASSEALTHYALYQLSGDIRAVVHVHNRRMWDQYASDLPATSPAVPYGTVEMAEEMRRLMGLGSLMEERALVMLGHEDGLITFGPSLAEASQRMIGLFVGTGGPLPSGLRRR